jgi:hypothetical protein
VSPFFIWLLRLLFAPQTLRRDPAPPRGGTPGLEPLPAPPAGGWAAAVQAVLGWILLAMLVLAAAAAVAAALYLLVRLLLGRTARTAPPLGGAPGSWRSWVRRLLCVLAALRRPRRPADVYARLLGWGRRSGLRPAACETPSEFGRRLAGAFPGLAGEIDGIVQAFNREAYALAPVPARQVAAAHAAWRRLRSPRQWPARGRRWWRGGAA